MGRPEDDGLTVWAKTIQVDLAGLTDLARVIRTENQRTLMPQSDTVRADFEPGVCFGGASASGYVYAAKARYQQSLTRAIEQLNAHVRAAEVLAVAAEQVARNYANSDAMSTAQMRDVEAALGAAITIAGQATRQPAPQEH